MPSLFLPLSVTYLGARTAGVRKRDSAAPEGQLGGVSLSPLRFPGLIVEVWVEPISRPRSSRTQKRRHNWSQLSRIKFTTDHFHNTTTIQQPWWVFFLCGKVCDIWELSHKDSYVGYIPKPSQKIRPTNGKLGFCGLELSFFTVLPLPSHHDHPPALRARRLAAEVEAFTWSTIAYRVP